MRTEIEHVTQEELEQRLVRLTPGRDGISSGNGYGLWLDTFAGKDDDERLDNALAASQAGAVKRPVLLSNREHTFARQRTLASGTKLINPFGFGNQQRGANSIPCLLKYTGQNAWWTLAAGQVFDVEFAGFGATAISNTGTTQFLRTGSSVLWTSRLHDLGFLNWSHVLGRPDEKALITAVELSGWWNVNNARSTSFTLGGSDSRLWLDGMLIDTPVGRMPADQYHLRFQWLQKSDIGGIYMTAENVRGILVEGSDKDGHLVFDKMRVEGRNAGQPSNELMRVKSGRVKIRDSWFGFTRGDYIAQDGGEVILDGCDFGLANGVPATTPVLRQTRGRASVRHLTANWGTPTTSGTTITT